MAEPAGDEAEDEPARLSRLGRLVADEPAGGDAAAGGDVAAGVGGQLQRLCLVLTRVLPVWGAGVSVLMADGIDGGMAAAWGPNSRALEELQFSFGEGPCMEAFTSGRPALEPDLPGQGMRRWPAYAPAAHDYGVRSVFAFPIQVGAARLGALDIYRDQPGSLTTATLSQAVSFADLAAGFLVTGQAAAHAGTGSGADDVLSYRAEVYQAQGMLTVDLGVSLPDAMARLRAHAFTVGRPLLEVARDVLAGTLKLDRDTP